MHDTRLPASLPCGNVSTSYDNGLGSVAIEFDRPLDNPHDMLRSLVELLPEQRRRLWQRWSRTKPQKIGEVRPLGPQRILITFHDADLPRRPKPSQGIPLALMYAGAYAQKLTVLLQPAT